MQNFIRFRQQLALTGYGQDPDMQRMHSSMSGCQQSAGPRYTLALDAVNCGVCYLLPLQAEPPKPKPEYFNTVGTQGPVLICYGILTVALFAILAWNGEVLSAAKQLKH